MFRIGEFSKMSKTTIKTLRYYDEVNLLKPEKIDDFNGYRFYTTEQLLRLHKIQSLRQIGLSIDEIKLIMSGINTENILEKRKTEILFELSETNKQLSRLEFILQGKEEEILTNYSATIKELPSCIVYTKKMTVSGYDAYFDLIPEIGARITEKYPELKCTTPEYCFIIYLDGVYKESNFNVEFCEAVDKIRPNFDDIVFKKIEASTAISVMHKGPYSSLSQAYIFALQWIERNGYVAADSPRESYIDGIWNKDCEEEWLTELQIPIAINN